MTWTAPRTWTTGELVTAAMMNTHVRDNTLDLRTLKGTRVYKSCTQSVTSGNNDVVAFGAESYDTNTMHDNATNNSRLVVPSGYDGFWMVYAHVASDADAANHNRWKLNIRLNAAGASGSGTSLQTSEFSGHTNLGSSFTSVVYSVAAADYFELFFQSQDETRVLQSGADATVFGAFFLGA